LHCFADLGRFGLPTCSSPTLVRLDLFAAPEWRRLSTGKEVAVRREVK